MKEVLIHVKNLVNTYQSQVVHNNLTFDIYQQEIMGIVGGSGTGKSTLLRTIIGLNKPQSGTIKCFDQDATTLSHAQFKALSKNWGILFQNGALFSSLTVLENVAFLLHEFSGLDKNTILALAELKINMVGLPKIAMHKYPNELSGGMIKRAGLARALALEPRIVFLDEPTAGLDPISAAEFDQLIRDLVDNLDLSVVMITHDLDSLFDVCDRIAVLVDKKIIVDTLSNLCEHPHPWIQSYFHGKRSRALLKQQEKSNG